MTSNAKPIDAQNDFRQCYRGRFRSIYHLSYLRLCKSKLIDHLLRSCQVSLTGAKVFDYAFGAGTFFLTLPKSAKIFGVELDPQVVAAVGMQLNTAGYMEVDLDVIEINSWASHRLISNSYDVIVCSHILEHLDDPVHFLTILRKSLTEGGVIVCLVPINEEVPDPHHVQVCNHEQIVGWAEQSDLGIRTYIETDHWNYWAKKYLPYYKRPVLRKIWSLGIGMIASLFPDGWWWRTSKWAGLLHAKPTQAGFVLEVNNYE